MTKKDTTTPEPADAIVVEEQHQPTLPSMELPEYHGRKPVGMKTALQGVGTRVTKAHTIGDRIVLVIEARVKTATHEETDDGLVYSEKSKVLDLFELDGDQGSRLISTLRSLYRTGSDAATGKTPVPGLGDVGYTDGSGVVLTPKELAALRGDPIRAVLSDDLTPAVVVYDDQSRALWPDEYDRDTPRPSVGDVLLTGPAVVELLHHETGEPFPLPKPKAVAAVPDLPEADEPAPVDSSDPFEGDLSDDVDGWEDDDYDPNLPTSTDFAFVDCPIDELREKLVDVADLVELARLRKAEEQGRGRALQQRAGALKAIDARADAIRSEG